MGNTLLDERFDGARPDPRLKWFCPPTTWSIDPGRGALVVTSDEETDFWRKTHAGFEADNGHFLYLPVEGDFVASTRVRFRPVNQYDQAGLMVRVSGTCWIKTSVEYEPEGASQLGAVVTNLGYSDWSTQPFPADRDEVWLRVRREGRDFIASASGDGAAWSQIRMAHLHGDRGDAPIDCGVYVCSPKGRGFVAEFDFLRIDGHRRV
ncbi:MAG: DUF1349 domain-containing protein [Phycisphaerae bacterium]|nr:DUF1349 domain-containing protein [Phycisphaerae bacterium]